MTDPNQEDRIRDLLRLVEVDPGQLSLNRSEIRANVLAAFDDFSAGAPNQNVANEDAGDLDIAELGTDDGSAGGEILEFGDAVAGNQSRPWGIGLAAMAAAVALLLIVLTTNDPTSQIDAVDTTQADSTQSDPTERRLLPDGASVPVELPAGSYSTSLIGDGLSFSIPDSFGVLEESTGRLVLADRVSGSAGQVVIVTVDPLDLEAIIQAMVDRGEVTKKTVTVQLTSGFTNRWDLSITDATTQQLACAPRSPCVELPVVGESGPIMLWAGSDNRVMVLGQSGEHTVLLIEQSQQFAGPIAGLTTELTDSIQLTQD